MLIAQYSRKVRDVVYRLKKQGLNCYDGIDKLYLSLETKLEKKMFDNSKNLMLDCIDLAQLAGKRYIIIESWILCKKAYEMRKI